MSFSDLVDQPDIALVCFDRDGTLIHDVPYNADPGKIALTPTARAALDTVRRAGLPIAVITNQSGVRRGYFGSEDVTAMHARLVELAGPIDAFFVCPHTVEDRCHCRKPAPQMLFDAAAHFNVSPNTMAYIGDIGTDMQAAQAAGARAVLVPTKATRAVEIDAAPLVATNLLAAVNAILVTP